jgi:hypothetical protein
MSNVRNVLEEVKFIRVATTTASGTSQVDGSIVDMTQDGGFDGVMFITTIATSNAGNYMQAQQGQAANLSDAATIAGSRVQSAANNDILILNLPKVAERYVRPNIVRTSATVLGEVYALLYRTGGPEPVVNGTATGRVVVTVNPGYAEGTP